MDKRIKYFSYVLAAGLMAATSRFTKPQPDLSPLLGRQLAEALDRQRLRRTELAADGGGAAQ